MNTHELPEVLRDDLILLQAVLSGSTVTHHIRVTEEEATRVETHLLNASDSLGHIRIDGALGYTAFLTLQRLVYLQSLSYDAAGVPEIDPSSLPQPRGDLQLDPSDAGIPNWSTTIWFTGQQKPLDVGMLHDDSWNALVRAINQRLPFAVLLDGDGERLAIRVSEIDFILALDYQRFSEEQISIIGEAQP